MPNYGSLRDNLANCQTCCFCFQLFNVYYFCSFGANPGHYAILPSFNRSTSLYSRFTGPLKPLPLGTSSGQFNSSPHTGIVHFASLHCLVLVLKATEALADYIYIYCISRVLSVLCTQEEMKNNIVACKQ